MQAVSYVHSWYNISFAVMLELLTQVFFSVLLMPLCHQWRRQEILLGGGGGGGAKGGGVCGGAPENFSSAMPSSLAINVTNAAPFIC